MTMLMRRAMTTGLTLITLLACSRNVEEKALVGRYQLSRPMTCQPDIKESILTIKPEGSYEQRVTFNTGRTETRTEHWTYDRKTRRISFSNFMVWSQGSFAVETSHPGLIG